MLPERYRVVAEIGAGGMGQVVRAHDSVLGRDVAIKMIADARLDARDREAFVREARAAARLNHPHIAVVHDVDPAGGWLVMELVSGRTLRDVIKAGAVPPAEAADIAAQVLAALAAAHGAGVIHRDVKPSNIMLGDDRVVKLVDFGIARVVDAELTDTSNQSGTPAYMAPEQIRGATIDARADLYALGATLFELVAGERFKGVDGSTPATLERIYQVCGAERGLARLIVGCLHAEPAARFASARDALAALRAPARPAWRRWAAIAAGVVAVSAIAGYWVGHRKPAASDDSVERAFVLAQRGENDKALQLLADHLARHPDDADAQTIALLATWWKGSTLDELEHQIAKLELRPAQRAMVQGIELITHRRNAEAVAFLRDAAKSTPGAVEIEYTLGEAMWHGGDPEGGAQTLAHAFALDPRWEMALHHVLEYRLSRGEASELVPIANQLRGVDPAAAAVLDCQLAIGERQYARAAQTASAALARSDIDKIPELYICLAQARALTGDIDGGAAAAKTAFELWPIETDDRGAFAQYAEFLIYRDQLDAYLELTRGRPSSQRALALLVRRSDKTVDVPKPEWPAKRMAPLGAATWLLEQHVRGVDASSVYTSYPEPEVRAWGAALAAEARGDRTAAIVALREALEVPSKGDLRMLVAHRLAHLLHDDGNVKGAIAACEEVIRPRYYRDYRAILLPDCIAWGHS